MLINLGTDVHGKNLGWDTSTGTPLTITGPDGSGKTMLLDSIIRQADSDGTLVTFTDQWDSIPPSPTIMCGRYRQPYELLEIVQRVSMEQRRRIKGEPEPVKPILLAFDDYDVHNGYLDMNLLNVNSQISDELSRIIEMAPGTNVNVVMVRSSIHPSTVGQKLYDRLIAGNPMCYFIRPESSTRTRNLFSTSKTPVKPKPSPISTGIWTSNRPAIACTKHQTGHSGLSIPPSTRERKTDGRPSKENPSRKILPQWF